MERPNPEGWKGGSEDFEFVRTLHGHRGVNLETDPEDAADFDWRRNAERCDLGEEY